MSAPADVQAATLQTFVDAWTRWNTTDYLDVLDKDFTQVMMPYNMGIPSRTRTEVEQVLPVLMGIVKNFQLTIHQTLHDTNQGKAAIYSKSTGDTPFGPWLNESTVFITFSKAGTKIARLEEMMDSAWMAGFFPKLTQYLQEQGKSAH